jgi:DNA-binding NarL/FixJ family response regulator
MVVVASPFMRETLVRSLRGLGAAEVVEAGSLAEARIRARGPAQRDLAIVDGTLPDGSGINLITELRSLGWSRALVMSTSEDPYTVRAALASGVRAFLVTPSATHEPARQPAGSPTPGRTGRASGAQGLSAREIEVLQLVSDGRSNKEIGEALGLSALTVKSHLARIARKLGTGDRAEMVVVAMRASVVV